MKIYKINLLNIFFKFLVAVIIFNAVFVFSVKDYNLWSSLLVTLLIVGIEFLVFFMTNTLMKIEITENNIQLFFKTLLLFENNKIITQDCFQYSYKEEIGAKGVKAEELSFYESNVKIVGIGRGFDGWTQEQVLEIVNNFEKSGIKKIE